MNNYVLDASVAAKWIFFEENSDKAEQLLQNHASFLVPDLFSIEMDSIISKKVRRREIDSQEALAKRKQMKKISVKYISQKLVAKLAFDIAISLPLTIYDATYLAVAIEKESVLYTADDRLVRGLSNTIFSDYIKSINEE